MRKPVIGVLPLYDENKDNYWMRPGYIKGIEKAGGIPVILPLTADEEIIRTLADMYDGFLFTGGHDIHPEIYGETKADVCGAICEERDRLEVSLLKRVLERNKPAFGICRGLQLFNVVLGGTLYQDIPAQLPSSPVVHKQEQPYEQPTHQVHIDKGNRLYEIVQTETLMVNSHHHQGIKKLSDRLQPLARAEDGLIEAVWMPGKPFVLAVQWHPEYLFQSDDHHFQLFHAFVRACQAGNQEENPFA